MNFDKKYTQQDFDAGIHPGTKGYSYNSFKEYQKVKDAFEKFQKQKAEKEAKQEAEAQEYCQDNNPFKILGVESNASQNEVKNAYSQLALKNHPDKCTGNQCRDMAEINNAYDNLTENLYEFMKTCPNLFTNSPLTPVVPKSSPSSADQVCPYYQILSDGECQNRCEDSQDMYWNNGSCVKCNGTLLAENICSLD
jgi:hypothetical protein